MSFGTEPGHFRVIPVAYPLLVECDMQGRILWMSEAAKSRIGDSQNLAGTVLAEWRAAGPEPGVSPLQVSRVMRIKSSLVISIEPPAAPAPEPGARLTDLERHLVHSYFRLQQAERTLSARVRRGPNRSGVHAIRQVERERQRVGRELHTGVGQLLAAIRLQLEIVGQQLPGAPSAVRQALDRIGRLAGDALDQVRSISRRLHPPEWQRLRLEEALAQLWDLSGVPQRYDAHLSIQPPAREPDLEVKILLYRAAQEALANLSRHARATRIEMSLDSGPDLLSLTIRDNGTGFDAAALFAAPASVAAGIGLRSIREQAQNIGAKFDVESGPSGTTLKVSAPYAPVGA